MILIPHRNGCTVIKDDKFCVINGFPPDIIHTLFIKEIELDSHTRLIAPTVKEIYVCDIESPSEIYCALLEASGIKVNRVNYVNPKVMFPEVLWEE